MTSIVLDSSVAISWLMPDEEGSQFLLEHVTQKGAIVPSLWSLEIGNVLLMACRKKRISDEQRNQALHSLANLPITIDTATSEQAWQETLELAVRYELTLYDASYLELALRRSLPLATFDGALQRAAELAGVLFKE